MNTEELLHAHDNYPPLNYDGMVEACDAIFGERKSISKERYRQLTSEASRISMERKQVFSDAVMITEFMVKVQNMDPGLYRLATFKTAHILHERGILPGIEKNLLLSRLKNKGFPYRLQWVPQYDADNELKNEAGFTYVTSKQYTVPAKSDFRNAEVVVSTLKSIKKIGKAHNAIQRLRGGNVKYPAMTNPRQKRRIVKLFITTSPAS